MPKNVHNPGAHIREFTVFQILTFRRKDIPSIYEMNRNFLNLIFSFQKPDV